MYLPDKCCKEETIRSVRVPQHCLKFAKVIDSLKSKMILIGNFRNHC